MSISAHVPDHLVVEFDHYNLPGGSEDVHLAYHAFQQMGPDIFWTPRNGGHWVITRAEDIKVVESDYERFSHVCSANIPVVTGTERAYPIEVDPPLHHHFRDPLVHALQPRKVEAMSDVVRETCVTLIEAFAGRGECEFVSEFAEMFPIMIFLDFVQLPLEDRTRLLHYTSNVTRPKSPEDRLPAFQGLSDYLSFWVKKRRENPGDDILSQMANLAIDGEKLPFSDAVGYVRTVCLGGLDTVTASLGFFMRFFAMNPGHRKIFRESMHDSNFIRRAVEELMRRHGLVCTTRVATHDFAYKDVPFAKGDMVLVPNLYAGLDDRCFPNPLTVDFDRSSRTMHAFFDFGPHTCVGHVLARRELRIFLKEWFGRIPDFTFKPGTKPVLASGSVNGVEELQLAWPVSSGG